MAFLKRAKTIVTNYLDSLQRHSTWIDDSLDEATISQVRLRLDDVKTNYVIYEKNLVTVEAEDDPDTSALRVKVENLYFSVRPALEDKLAELNYNNDDDTGAKNIAPTMCAKLPEIFLTTFSGDIMKLSEFIECFDSLVHANPALSVIAKFQYLKHALKDAAANAIDSLDFTEENYTVARDILRDRFCKPNRICDHHIKWLFSARAMDKPCPRRLMELLEGFISHLRSLRTLHRPTEQWDDLMVYLLASKFDSETRAKWCEAAPTDKIATFADISKFVKMRCAKLELLPAKITTFSAQPRPLNSVTATPTQSRLSRFHNSSHTYHATSNEYHCVFCDKSTHSILRFYAFLKLSIMNRRDEVECRKLCFNCLKPNHFVDKCPSNDSCKVCRHKHHTLLHLSTSSKSHPGSSSQLDSPSFDPNPSTSSGSTTLASTGRRHQPSYVFLATALVEVKDKFGCQVIGRAILDSGSQLNFISQAFASRLRLPLHNISAEIGGIGSSTVKSTSSGLIKTHSVVNNFTADLEVLVLPSIASLTPTMSVNLDGRSIPKNVTLADPKFFQSRRIDILIGAELYLDLLKVGQIKLGKLLPSLQNTVLGWIVSGRASSDSSSIRGQTSLLVSSRSTIDDEIEKFWKLESVPEGSKIVTTNDHPCDRHFGERFVRDKSGRFIVRLPFIRPPIALSDSSTMAMRRFYNLEKRLSRDVSLHAAYKSFVDEYLELGNMELVPNNEIPSSNYYLPHHCVLKPDSSTTKLRVVFDGSAKSSNGCSLNDILMVGPVVQNDLISILCRFRAHKYAFSTDISKMYRQIRVNDEDSNYQMIFWRNHPNEPLQSYKLKTVTYGNSSAPFLATRCLVQCAIETHGQYPDACNAILHDMYVDDMLTGSSTISSAHQLKEEIIRVLSTCGMDLRKWCSNSPDVIADIPEKHHEQLMQLDNDDYVKTLGIYWQPQKDVFQFRVLPAIQKSKVTKCIVISEIARLFDPLGFVSPVVVLGKLFMQRLWQLKLNWDEALPMNFHSYWESYRSNLCELNRLSVPRFLFDDLQPSGSIEIHGFADASESAYGAVIYTRCQQPNGKFLMRLLCSKSRVAPLQKTTLPRLELCAAQLLAQLMSQVRSIINFPVTDVIYWTDSTIVLHWLNSTPSDLKTFVANRVSNIQELTDAHHWFHVASKQNPADVVSRGMMPALLMGCDLWFSGPSFLQSSKSPWLSTMMPQPTCIEPEFSEFKKSTTLMAVPTENDSIFAKMKYFGNYHRLTRMMAYSFRFLHNIRSKIINRISGPLNRKDFDGGLTMTIHLVQSESFSAVKDGLRRKNFVVRSSNLKSLSPFLDGDGIIRVGGRLQFSTIPYYTKHPILQKAPPCWTTGALGYGSRKILAHQR